MPKFADRLRSVVKQFDRRARGRATGDLVRLAKAGLTSLGALAAVVRDGNADIELRRLACWALRLVPDRRALPALLTALRDEDPILTLEAASALARVRDRRSVPVLVRTLKNPESADRRVAAAYALGHIGDRSAVLPLIRVLGQSRELPKVRGSAAEALAYLRDRRAVRPLLSALGDRAPEVRFWAAFALGELGDPRALARLHEIAKRDRAMVRGWWPVRREAASAIARIEARVER